MRSLSQGKHEKWQVVVHAVQVGAGEGALLVAEGSCNAAPGPPRAGTALDPPRPARRAPNQCLQAAGWVTPRAHRVAASVFCCRGAARGRWAVNVQSKQPNGRGPSIKRDTAIGARAPERARGSTDRPPSTHACARAMPTTRCT